MSGTKITIVHDGNEVKVSPNGELITRVFEYSEPSFQTIDAANTAFNFFKPKKDFRFVLTGAIISGNRDVGVNGAVLTLYEAAAADSLATTKTSFEIEVPKSTVLPFIIPHVLTDEGTFLNGKADDTVVRVGLFGYFVPVF